MTEQQREAAIKWDLTSVSMHPNSTGPEQLVRLLDKGWEPFAATQMPPHGVIRYHLRRPRPSSEHAFDCKRCDQPMPAGWPHAVCANCEIGSTTGDAT